MHRTKTIPNKKIFRLLLLLFLLIGTTLSLVSCTKNEDKFIPPTPVETKQPVDIDYLNDVVDLDKDQLETDEPLLDLDEFDVKYIVTSPAQDTSTMININYMTKNARTSVEYTKAEDSEFSSVTKVTGKCYPFEETELVDGEIFEKRNVCRVTINNLTPNTKYMYRVNKGNDTYSDPYYFTTSGNGDTTSFLFMSDNHYYHGFDGAEVNEDLIQKALEIQPNLDFYFTTGDWVDRGGDSRDWDKFFQKAESLKYMPYTGVPGNHEYYDAERIGNKIYAAHFNNPRNGVDGFKGVSYYFVHNDTLFIQIDTQFKYNHQAQLEWLERIIYNNPTKYVIVGTHPPFNLDNTDHEKGLVRAMEKMGVDLVLSGHYHSHRYQANQWGGAPSSNPLLGVNYLNGTYSGIKGKPADADPKTYARGYIIDITDEKITIRYIDANGKVYNTYTINNKRKSPKEGATKQELLDSITDTYDPEKATLTFGWSPKFYRNVKYMKVQANYRNVESEYIFFPTPGYTSYTVSGIDPDLDYSYTLTLYFEDGSTLAKTFFLESDAVDVNPQVTEITATSAKLSVDTPPDRYRYIVRAYEVYLNGELRAVFNALDADFRPVTSTVLTHLSKNTDYEVVVKVYGRDGYMYHATTSFRTSK